MQKKHSISSHVLNLETGQPAHGFPIRLLREKEKGEYELLHVGLTNGDGRIPDLLAVPLEVGRYQVVFDVAEYYKGEAGVSPFMQQVALTVQVDDVNRHYHVPLLVTRYACSSYRGS